MADEMPTAWQCPKDATVMEPIGRRGRSSGAWRCPQCGAIFFDTAAMRRGRGGRPPMWSPVVTSVLVSLLVTFIVRRLKRRRIAQSDS
jgi:hypothetical protein